MAVIDIVFIGVYLNCLLYNFQLEQEFELIMHSSETMKTFEAAWKTWEPAIISYAKHPGRCPHRSFLRLEMRMKVNLFCNFTSWIVRTAGSRIVLLLPYLFVHLTAKQA